MKTCRLLIGAAAVTVLASIATGAMASGTVSQTSPASATIVSPYTLSTTTTMAFGLITRPNNANANTVTLDANDTVTLSGTGDGALVASTTSTARFTLTGTPVTYSTSQGITMTPVGLGTVNAATPVATTGTYGAIPGAGSQELRIGGSFNITSATPAVPYSGTLTLTVNYN